MAAFREALEAFPYSPYALGGLLTAARQAGDEPAADEARDRLCELSQRLCELADTEG